MERNSADSHGDDWELDPNDVEFRERIASGAFGDLFRGNYCGQDVAIKVLKNVQDDSMQYREFLQASLPCWSDPRSPFRPMMACARCTFLQKILAKPHLKQRSSACVRDSVKMLHGLVSGAVACRGWTLLLVVLDTSMTCCSVLAADALLMMILQIMINITIIMILILDTEKTMCCGRKWP